MEEDQVPTLKRQRTMLQFPDTRHRLPTIGERTTGWEEEELSEEEEEDLPEEVEDVLEDLEDAVHSALHAGEFSVREIIAIVNVAKNALERGSKKSQ